MLAQLRLQLEEQHTSSEREKEQLRGEIASLRETAAQERQQANRSLEVWASNAPILHTQ